MKKIIRLALLQSDSMEPADVVVLQSFLDTIDRLNAAAGEYSFPLQPTVIRCSPERSSECILELLKQGISIFCSSSSSVSRKSVLPVLEEAGALLFFPYPHEGLTASRSIIHTGLTLNQQLLPLLHWMKAASRKSIYFLGSNRVYQHLTGRMLRLLAAENNIRFDGEFYIPEHLTEKEKEEAILDALKKVDSDLLAVSCSDNDAIRLQRLSGRYSSSNSQALIFLDGEVDPSHTNQLFRLCSEPGASIAVTGARHSIQFLRMAALAAGDVSAGSIREALEGLELVTESGTVRIQNNLHIEQDTLIVEHTRQGRRIVHRERLAPLPYLGLENLEFELRPLALQAMSEYASMVSLLVEQKNPKHQEHEPSGYRQELEALVHERTQSLELCTKKLEDEIRKRQLLEEAVGESQRRLRQILDHTSLVAVVLDQRGCIVFANQTLLQKTGWERHEIIERNWFEMFIPQRPELPEKYLSAIRSGTIRPKLEQTIRTRKGETLIIRWSNTLLIEGQEITGCVSIGEDITEQRAAVEALRRSEEKLRALFTSMTDIILVIREDGSLEEVAPTASDLIRKKGTSGRSLADLFPEEQTEFFLQAIRKALHQQPYITLEYSIVVEGMERWYEARLSAISSSTVLFISRDATERVLAQRALHAANIELERRVEERTRELQVLNQRLREIATKDELTGIANRRLFNEALDSEIRRARRDKRSLSLLLCDVDHFKKYNDRYGHQAGDECLKRIGRLLSSLFRRAGELPARYGGEEFAVILPGTDAYQAILMAEKLRAEVEAMHIPHEASETSPWVTLSIGVVSVQPKARHNAAFFITEADKALYRSKNEGRNRVTVASVEP